MTRLHILAGTACLATLAACAVDPNTYDPAPAPPPVMDDPQAPAPQPGEIAACGHAGAPEVSLRYPDGWQARLAEGARQTGSGGGGGELLGGPSQPDEVVARDAQPVAPPMVEYPQSAASARQEGRCEILMDVSPTGTPEEILTACSAPQFNASAYRAATSMRFDPPRRGGQSVRLVNVVYPVTYCMDE